MYLDTFYTQDGDNIRITAQQASRFAKEIADDFNPIHDADSKRFCVPGDLLFSLILARYGISQYMHFRFQGMVKDNTPLLFPQSEAAALNIQGQEDGKDYLSVERSGEHSHDEAMIEYLSRHYVSFSGLNFPHTLQPLLAEQNVMINPSRPMVIYESMEFRLDNLQAKRPLLEATQATLELKGKRGEALLGFRLLDEEKQVVGSGLKRLLLGGLIPYQAEVAEELVKTYESFKTRYKEVKADFSDS